MRAILCLSFVGLASCVTGEFWLWHWPHHDPPTADGGSDSGPGPDETPAECTALACRFGASCLEPTSYVTCRCPEVLPDSCPPLSFAGLLLPDNAAECWPRAMSGDGRTIVGNCSGFSGGTRPVSWAEGEISAPEEFGESVGPMYTGVDFDGSTLIGQDERGCFRQDGHDRTYFPEAVSYLSGISADGSVVAGTRTIAGRTRGFVWRESTGFEDLGTVAEDDRDVQVSALSSDGLVVVGQAGSSDDPWSWRAFHGSAERGLQTLPLLAGAAMSSAQAVSADGRVIVGTIIRQDGSTRPVRWVDDRVEALPTLPAESVGFGGVLSADGNTSAYTGHDEFLDAIVVWSSASGVHNLRELLRDSGADLSEWSLLHANGISADGRTLVLAASYAAGDRRPRAALVHLP